MPPKFETRDGSDKSRLAVHCRPMPLPPPPSPLILLEHLHHACMIIKDHRYGQRKGLLRRCELWLDATTDLHVHLYISPSESLKELYQAVIDAERCILDIEHANLMRGLPRMQC